MSQRKKIYLINLVICISILLLTGCKDKVQDSKQPITRNALKLNTIISITIYDSKDESILDGAMKVIDKYEQIYSRTLETSELYQLNNRTLPSIEGDNNSFQVSDELAEIIDYGLQYSELSKGLFDITIAPVSSLWDFTSGLAILPENELLEDAVTKVSYKNVSLEGNVVHLKDSQISFDLGAIAKGYIADRLKDYLLEQGVKSAMINLGGNVLCVGEKPSGQPYKIGIQKPFAGRNEVVATMDIRDLSVVSSGVYERYFMKDDVLYHHILDPSTGYPINNNLISITIISPKSVDGDGLSTTCFGLGLEEGMKLINSLEDTYAIFITDDYNLHYSDGFFENITVNEIE